MDKRRNLEILFTSTMGLTGILFAVVLFELIARQNWKDFPSALYAFDAMIWLTIIAILIGGITGFLAEFSLNRRVPSDRVLLVTRWLFRAMLAISTLLLPIYLLCVKRYF